MPHCLPLGLKMLMEHTGSSHRDDIGVLSLLSLGRHRWCQKSVLCEAASRVTPRVVSKLRHHQPQLPGLVPSLPPGRAALSHCVLHSWKTLFLGHLPTSSLSCSLLVIEPIRRTWIFDAIGYVALNKSLNFSEPHFLHL